MKKILIGLTLIASISLTSCSDFLDTPIRGKENLDTYFQNSDDAEKYITGCYGAIAYNDWWQIGKFWNMTDMCSDDAWMGNTAQDQTDYLSLAHYKGQGQDNESVANFWQYRYKGILRCNIAIENIPQAPMVDTEKRDRLIAEAKFIRAVMYFELVKNFGDVPLITEFKLPEDIKGITRAPIAEIYAFIESDLKGAIEDLPLKGDYASTDVGRATKGAAQGYLGKIYLYQEKWSDARDILAEVIASQEYELMDDFGDVWSPIHNNNSESLFEIQYMYDGVYNLGGFLSIVSGNRDDNGWGWGLPSSNLEQAFIDAGDQERLKWTIIKHGTREIAGEHSFSQLINTLSDDAKNNYPGTYAISPSKHKSARLNRKFFIPFSSRPVGDYDMNLIPLNHRMLRYADVLLMYAEAKNVLGEDSGDKGAQWALNEVRGRVDLGEVTSTGRELRNAIRLERRLELALEHNRLYDIRRWNDDNGNKAIANIMGTEGTFVKYNARGADQYERENQGEPSNKGESFKADRDLVFPIPLYEITTSGGTITQNPGWN